MNKRRKMEVSDVNDSIVSESKNFVDNVGIDFFSRLPDSVIAQIFYFLPMRESFETCFLSKNLCRLCTSIPNLEFKDLACCIVASSAAEEKVGQLVQVINKFLEHHDGPIRSCRLSLRHEWCIINVVRWITLLMQHGVEDLDLDLHLDPDVRIKLPSVFYNSKILRALKLKSCSFEPPPEFIGSSSLVTLGFSHMILLEDLIRTISSQCSLLHSLTF